ncbi:MAG: hypothetical protein PHC91_00850 [Eubacteriales bacterium]|nr:hypothetical protein [Eubacteriales bacterium]
MDFITSIEEIETSLFGFDIKTGMRQFESLTEALIRISGCLDQSALPELFNIINVINSSLENKDYLLFNDLLEYELKPFLSDYIS